MESTSSFFFVDAWFSYDITGLSAATPNAPVTAKLTVAEQNDPARAVDLALGRKGAVVEDAPPASRIARNVARKVFKRVTLESSMTVNANVHSVIL